jgi:hypothetical protein
MIATENLPTPNCFDFGSKEPVFTVSHGCWNGAYALQDFDHFKTAVYAATGKRYRGIGYFALPGGEYVNPRFLYGDWGDFVPADAAYILLMHAGDGGSIAPNLCERLAARLESLLPVLEAGVPVATTDGTTEGWGVVTRRFIEGLRQAAAAKEPIEFRHFTA